MRNRTRVLVVGESLFRAKEIDAQFTERAWEPCGKAESIEQAIEMVSELGPDLVVLNARTATLDCAGVAREIRRAAPSVKICFFSDLPGSQSLTPD